MIYENTLAFAENLDAQDELIHFRNEFLIPQYNGEDSIYLCGNSLGLQPKSSASYINEVLNQQGNIFLSFTQRRHFCLGRGRDIGRPIPPAQIPTGGITA